MFVAFIIYHDYSPSSSPFFVDTSSFLASSFVCTLFIAHPAIIDKTAVWVARNGSTFEAKVAEKQKDNPQFAFLRYSFTPDFCRFPLNFVPRPGNAYYAYYQQKVREIRREEGIATEGDTESVRLLPPLLLISQS